MMAAGELAALRRENAALRAQVQRRGGAAPPPEQAEQGSTAEPEHVELEQAELADAARHFAREGWLVVDGVIAPPEVEALRAVLDEPEFAPSHSADQYASQMHVTTLHPALLALARDPRIVRRIVPLLGPNIQLHHSKTSTKPSTPGTGALWAWHQE